MAGAQILWLVLFLALPLLGFAAAWLLGGSIGVALASLFLLVLGFTVAMPMVDWE